MHNTWLDSNRNNFRVRFIAKQRSGFGFDYMSFSLMRGKNPMTLYYPHVIKLVTQAFKVTIAHFTFSHYS